MYAAAGGASLASRQARRNVKKQHVIGNDAVHQQLQKRFNQLHQQHAPAASGIDQKHPSLDPSSAAAGRHQHLLRTAPVGLHSRLPSYVDLNDRITGFGSCDVSEIMTSSSMQAALYIREKQKQRLKKFRRGRFELPSHVATKEIAPFPTYPPHTWGKAAAAWSERDRRPSAVECSSQHRVKALDAHRRWMKRNRIHDSSFGGSSSEDEDFPGGLYGHQSAAANALLYVGLGTVAIGLVIAFVGTGEKGFKTLELRLIGPTLIGSGVLCCLVRVFLCVCPTRCLRRRFRHRHRRKHHSAGAELNRHNFHSDKSTDYYKHLPYNRAAEDFMLVEQSSSSKKNKKRVSIIPAGSSDNNKSQHQQQLQSSRSSAIPQISLPNFVNSPVKEENLIELSQLGNSFEDINSLSSEDSFNDPDNLILVEGSKQACVIKDINSAERLARLKSTLTFDDSSDLHECLGGVTRIDEEDSETLDIDSNQDCPTSPMLTTSLAVETTHIEIKKELVLSPAKLQNNID